MAWSFYLFIYYIQVALDRCHSRLAFPGKSVVLTNIGRASSTASAVCLIHIFSY
jgi:hypothetical protein